MSAGRCLLKNGILWDTKKMVDILIDDERIVQIVPGQSLGAVDARIIDLTGKTILPGFLMRMSICMEFVAHFQMNFCTDLYWAG